MHADLHCTKPELMGISFLPNKPSCAEVANRKKGINNGSCGGWDDAHYSNIFIL